MPWARFDDQFPINRKVNGLTDTEFRLHVEAIIWCARELTDGRVGRDELDLVSRIRSPKKHVAKLVIRGLWHLADEECSSPKCPAHVDNRVDKSFNGWLIHDYFDYQFTKEQVLAERQKNAERQKRHRDLQKHDRNGVTNGGRNGVTNKAPSRPVPSRRDGGSVSDHSSVPDARANNHDDDQDPVIQTIIGVLKDETGRTVEPDWAEKIRRQILGGRQVTDPARYIAACIRANPHDYLPTGDDHPASRSVREALAAARGEGP